jgi:DNA-binding response OmpR family regulator
VKILLAEDDLDSLEMLRLTVASWGFKPVTARDGVEAWYALQRDNDIGLVVVDWMMPRLSGLELCRQIRSERTRLSTYVVVLTGLPQESDLVGGLEAGADDYVIKPFRPAELRARLQVGVRVLALQNSLGDRVKDLETALARVKRLEGMLPICSYCKKIRDRSDYWHEVETYVAEKSGAEFTHGICPACLEAFKAKVEQHALTGRR